mgnify:CR=1 FL=1
MCCNSPFSGIPLATNHLWQGGFLIYKEATHHSFHFFFSVSSASSVVKKKAAFKRKQPILFVVDCIIQLGG